MTTAQVIDRRLVVPSVSRVEGEGRLHVVVRGDEVLEAPTLDGYGPFRRLTRITLPLISPVLMFLLVILVIVAFQAFPQIEIITNGGPAGASETLVFKIFRQSQDYGKGAVLSVGLFFVTMVITFLQFVILDRRVHYGDE